MGCTHYRPQKENLLMAVSRNLKLFAVLLVCVLATMSAAVGREWRDASGTVSREAEFVGLRDGQVFVRLANGHDAVAPLDQLSAADQAYVKSVATKVTAKPATAAVGDSPVPVRMANYQPGAAPASAAPPVGAAADDDARAESEMRSKYGEKYVFRTFCCRFHIILYQDGVYPIIGTAHYSMPYFMPPCCGCCCPCPCCGPFYLSFLKKTRITYSWIEAEEVGGTGPIKYWRFWWESNCCCQHKITYSKNGRDWYLYDYATRTEPK
jgi:hypothetical protein